MREVVSQLSVLRIFMTDGSRGRPPWRAKVANRVEQLPREGSGKWRRRRDGDGDLQWG